MRLSHFFGQKSEQKAFCLAEQLRRLFDSPGVKLPPFAFNKNSHDEVPVLGS
jgi:hypothetical protein